MVERYCVKFGDPSCIDFLDIMWKKDRQADTNATENPTHPSTIDVDNDCLFILFCGLMTSCSFFFM